MKDIALDFRFRKDAQRGVFVVQMVDPAREVGEDLAFDFGNQSLTRVLERIERDQCTLDDLREIGVNLWAGLMSGKVGERFEAFRQEIEPEGGRREPVRFQLRLTLPPELEALPWESLYHEKDFGFIACHPDHCVLRSPPASIHPPALPPPHGGKLKILAVIPSGSGLNAEHEWHNLELAVSTLRDRVDLERLSGRVDADRLGEHLRTQRYDVVHFIGHGEQTSEGKSFVRLNSDEPGGETKWIEGEQFGNLFINSSVRLAVLNCCLGAKPSPLRSMSGLGPFLLRAGIPAVIAMRYEIADAVAIRFADKLYRELLNGLLPGRIDLAVEHARRSIYQTQDESDVRAFVTPILFLSPGCEQLFEIESTPDPGPVDVYLAEVADSLRKIRKRIHDDLTREGVSVAWNVPPPFEAESHRQQVTTVLKRARLSVHLLDGYAGREIDGKPETTYPQEQVRLARDQARSPLIWMPRQLAEIDDGQEALLAELRSGGGLHEGTPPSELVEDILARLRQDRPLPEEPRAVLLDGHPKDEKVLGEVEDFLRRHHVRTYVHRPQSDLRQDTERLLERLRTVGALVLCHGEVEETWVGSRLDEALKAAFDKLKLFCVYIAPPAKDLRLYERYKVLQDLNKVALLPNPQGPLEDGTFAPLFETLGVGRTA